VKWRRRYKGGPEATLEGETWSISALVPPSLVSLAHGPSPGEKLIIYFFFDFYVSRRSLKEQNTKKEIFYLPEIKYQ
jgi:hypothetical protein